MIAPQHSRAAQVHPGLTSWDIFCRPYGTGLGGYLNPGLTSWATLSRPYGTGSTNALIADLFSASALHTSRSTQANYDKCDRGWLLQFLLAVIPLAVPLPG
jgi:hypothetical protein